MRHNDKETAELSQDVIELSDKLATLKRQPEQLRAAAYDYVYAEDRDRAKALAALRAALDATPAEPANPSRDLVSAVRGALGKLRHSNVWAIEDTREILENALSKQGQDL